MGRRFKKLNLFNKKGSINAPFFYIADFKKLKTYRKSSTYSFVYRKIFVKRF